MKKTNITTLLYILLAMALCLTLAACNTTPATNDPADTNPEATQPQDTNPQETDPVDTAPVDTAPVDTAPVDTAPVDTAPVDTGTTDTDPTETDPTDTDPADTDPVDPPKTIDVTYEQNEEGEYVVTGLVDPNATDIVIPSEIDGKKISAIAEGAFKNNGTLKSVVIEDGIEIGVGAFSDCISLETVVLPSTLSVLPDAVFSGCTSLSNIEFPLTITQIDTFAFFKCPGTLFEEEDGIYYLGNWAIQLADYGRTEVAIREGTVGVAAYFAQDPTSSNNVPDAIIMTVPDGVKYIGYSAFSNVSAALNIPATVEVIDDYAFQGATGLPSNLELPSVTYIGRRAFEGATSLQKVTLGPNVEYACVFVFGPKGKIGPFYNCPSISEVVLMSGNQAEEEYFLGTKGPEITFIYPDAE